MKDGLVPSFFVYEKIDYLTVMVIKGKLYTAQSSGK